MVGQRKEGDKRRKKIFKSGEGLVRVEAMQGGASLVTEKSGKIGKERFGGGK